MANIHSVITYNANLSPAQAQIKALTGQVNALSLAFNTLDKSALTAQKSLASTFAANVGQIGGFTAKTVQASSAVENFGKALSTNRLTMRQYFREAFAGYTRQNSMLKQLAVQQVRYQQSIAVSTAAGQAMVITPAQVNALTSSTAIAAQKFSIFNKLIDGGATSLLNFGKNTQWAGRQLMVGFTLPLALFTAAVSKQFRDLDSELTRFQKVYGQDLGNTTKQATAEMRKQVEELAFQIGKNYGIAAKDTAALAADIAATGAEGEKLISSVQQTTRLAVLGEVDRQDAMKATLALQTAFKMNTDELAESVNYLNAVENQTSTTLQDFATAIPKVGPVIQSLGGDIEDLSILLVAMREGGIPAAEAANALKSGLASLINPTQKASDVAEKFGVNLRKIVEDNKGELMPTIYSMQNALSDLDDFSKARVIEEIFGKYQFARMSALFSNLGKTGSQTQQVLELAAKSSTELASIANAELKTLQESTAMKFQRSLENLRNVLIPIGETLTESLIPIFEFIGGAASKFIEFFQSLPEPVKNFAKYGTAVAALAGPVIMLVGLFGNLIANGIKFGMMVVRMGARIAGLRVEKFELLNSEVMAAKLGVDNLTGSFTNQDKALRQLIGALSSYGSSLRTLQSTNPALFVPGAGRPPIKRASGSNSPEFVPGSGRGDKIPAMLEPGEFIVNRKATEKYAPVLMQMNRGNLPGYQGGTSSPVGFGSSSYSAPTGIASRYPIGEGMARGHIFGTGREAKSLKIDGNYFLWHKKFWVEISQEENQLMNILQLSSKKNQPLFQKTLQGMNVDQAMTERIMAKIRSGVMFSEQEARIAHEAIRKLAGQIDRGEVPAKEMTKALGKYASSVSRLPGLTALTLEKIRGAERQLISGITSIGATSGPEAERARKILAEKLLLVRGLIQQVGAAPTVISAEIAKILQMASPSRVFAQIGRNTAAGLLQGVSNLDGAARGAGVELGNEVITGVRSVVGAGLGPIPPSDPRSPLMQRLAARAGQTPGTGGTAWLGMPSMPERRGSGSSGLEESYKGTRGQGLMNAAFAASMATSAITMFSGATGEAAEKMMMFSTGLTTALFALQAVQGFGIGGKLVGGVKGAGAGIARAGTALSGAGGGIGRFGGLLAGGGGALAGSSTAAIIAISGVATALAAVGVSLYLYKKSLDEVRERAIAAFKDPVETVRFFGKEVKSVTDSLKEIQASNASAALEDINSQLREAVSSDYATLIEKIKNSTVTVGASDLGAAYTKMIISGLSAEEATDAIKAIAAEAGTAGGYAYARAFGNGLLKSNDPEKAFDQMLDMIDPNSEYNRSRVSSLMMDKAAIRGERLRTYKGGPGPRAGGPYTQYTPEQLNQLGSIAESLEISGEAYASTLQAALQLSQTNPEKVVESAEKLRQAYLSLSTDAGINLFGMGQSAQEVAFDSFKNMIGELNDPMLNKIMDSLQDATPEAQALAMELVGIGGSLNDAADASGNFDTALAEAAIRNTIHLRELEQAVKDATEAVLDLANSDEFNTRIERNEKRLERFSRARDRYIKDREEEKEALEDSFNATQEGIENEIKALNKEQDRINRVTNAYLKSLSRRAEADKFYANQRKTSLGALESLASGNVFGFLQAREQMGEQARDFAYQNEIQKIEDKRDAEIDAIDRAIDKKNEQIDLNNKAHDEQMKAFDKETEKHSKELDKQYKRQSAHVNSMKNLQKEIADGQIVTYDEMKEAYGKRLADEYKMLVENQIKATALELRAAVATDRMDSTEAEKRLIDMYNALQGGTAYTGGTPTAVGGYSNAVPDYATLAEILGLPEMTIPRGVGPRGVPGGAKNVASGGYISGPGTATSDSIPARLSNGEYVIQASSVKKYGTGLMDAINTQNFAEGGPVELERSLKKWVPRNKLSFYSNWENYGSWPGGKPSGIMMHHTAGVGPGVLEWMARNPEAGKPVVQTMIGRDGTAHILAYGGTGWGAGAGGTGGSYAADIWKNKEYSQLKEDLSNLGGASNALWQMEVESWGTKKDFTAGMFDTIARVSAAIREYSKWNSFAGKIINHRDWAAASGPNRPGGQRGDTLYELGLYRSNAEAIWNKSTGGSEGTGSGGKPSSMGVSSTGAPTSMANGPRSVYGKSTPLFVAGRMLPGSGGGGGGNGGGGKGGRKPSTGTGSFTTPLPYGADAGKARVVLDAVKAAWPQNLHKVAWTIAMRESLGENLGPGHSKFNGSDYGIFQINKGSYGSQSWWDENKLLDPAYNARVAYTGVSRSGASFLPWAMKVNNNGAGYSWDWKLYGGVPDWGYSWTMPATKAFWGSWAKKAAGGFISGQGGPRSDIVPALLSNGEYVMKAGAVDKYGRGFMDQINSGNFNMPSFGMPSMPAVPSSSIATNVNGGSYSSSNSSNNVKIVINGASGKSATAIANKVASMINSSNNRRNHSRSI